MISVVVPTFDRPNSLQRAVRSVFAQTLADDTGFTLIIVDNTPSGTAAATLDALRRACPDTIVFKTLHAPEPGVANARNAAMDLVEGPLVAFLDDDQSAPPDWLEALLAAYEKTPAAVTFGPVKTALPDGIRQHRTYFEAFFARALSAESGYIDEAFGCGNALIDFAQIAGPKPWFDAKMNEMGGEDDLLFDRVRRSGQRFAWAADARVWEHPPKARVTLR
ncbi:MAG: glycosyltransferase family 2 protein, partial [Pseudomonadota bacterium]